LLFGFGDHGADRFLIAHIGEDSVSRSTLVRDLRSDRCAVLGVGENNLGAFGCQGLGENRAERSLRARGRSGDDRNLSVETWHWHFPIKRRVG
jgi:hypothetical protein